jgi:DNA-binding NtrC family response regulator
MSRTVLLVNDNPVSRRNLAQLLSDEGFRVEQAEDTESAMRLVTTRQFDVVVSGYVVHGQFTGIDILRACPKSGKVLYTAFPPERTQPLAKSLGALLVSKPAPFENLLKAIQIASSTNA